MCICTLFGTTVQIMKEIDVRDKVRRVVNLRERRLHVLWFERLLTLLRIPNKLDFFLALSVLRLLPPEELRLIEDESY